MAKRGPQPDTLKIEGMTWQQAIKKALSKPKPQSDPKPKVAVEGGAS